MSKKRLKREKVLDILILASLLLGLGIIVFKVINELKKSILWP